MLGRGGRESVASVASGFADRHANFHTRGRYALYEAYRLAGIGPQGALLAPAYHCRTMLDPAISLGGSVLLYALKENLAPDIDGLARMVAAQQQGDGDQPRIRALLLTHYFGFPQETEAIVAFCSEHGIVLIEDCSHACFGLSNGQVIGTIGDYAVASPYKFFPCEDGGMLVANRGAAMPRQQPRAAGVVAELRGIARVLVAARDRGRRRVDTRDLERLDDELRALLARPQLPQQQPLRLARESEEEQSGCSALYSADEEGRAGLAVSRWVMRASNADAIAGRRRANYRAWLDGVAGLPNCRVLFPVLPEACVPYMFPLYVEHPDPHFYLLKHLGVPIWRWDEMAVSAVSPCSVAADYRLHLIHLPCHQNLHHDELAWMMAAVAAVMRTPPESVGAA